MRNPDQSLTITNEPTSPKRILGFIIGINEYPESPLELCVNDATYYREMLTGFGMIPEHCIQLLDGAATAANIRSGFHSIIENVQPGDAVVLTYSGHGSYLPCTDEPDGTTEILCPVDIFVSFENNGIYDDEIRVFAEKISEKGGILWVVADCCHSGDLSRSLNGRARFIRPPENTKGRVKPSRFKTTVTGAKNVLLLSGCDSDEVSFEFQAKGHGALTYAIKTVLPEGGAVPMRDLYHNVARIVNRSFKAQHPQLEGDEELMDRPFLKV